MLNLFSSGGISKCGTLFPSLSRTKYPSSETSYQAGCKLLFKKYIGSFLLWHFWQEYSFLVCWTCPSTICSSKHISYFTTLRFFIWNLWWSISSLTRTLRWVGRLAICVYFVGWGNNSIGIWIFNLMPPDFRYLSYLHSILSFARVKSRYVFSFSKSGTLSQNTSLLLPIINIFL